MKIGVLCSGNDMLALFKFLSKYDNEYIIFYDQLFGSWGDKSFELVMERVEKGISVLVEQGVDKIIVSPVVELFCSKNNIGKDRILPLFQNYVMEYCFKYSLVGKLGLFGDLSDVNIAQELFQGFEKEYSLQEVQGKMKKFKFPFTYWVKEVSMWKYFLTKFSWSNVFVNKLVKNDLSYFKDAGVDTLIPLNYGYFHFEKTIGRFFNFKKTRFHILGKLENIFSSLIGTVVGNYSVKVFYTDHVEFLEREKRLVWLLERGKSVKVEYVKVDG